MGKMVDAEDSQNDLGSIPSNDVGLSVPMTVYSTKKMTELCSKESRVSDYESRMLVSCWSADSWTSCNMTSQDFIWEPIKDYRLILWLIVTSRAALNHY